MRNQIGYIFATVLISSLSLAQTNNSRSAISMKETNAVSTTSEGLRIRIFKPQYKIHAKVKFNSNGVKSSDTGTIDLDMGNGLAVGVVSLPVNQIGYIAEINYIELKVNDSSTNTVRLDGNGAFAFNNHIYANSGLNYTQYVGKRGKDIKGDFGFQAGVGLKATANFGVDLTYSESNLSSKSTYEGFSSKADMKIKGYEIGLSGTF